ncbi:MAG: flippase-like domain-containing protein [Candidatus Omnitrophica bacterium]|nr:flippase-like domain-containing protein [Candidatus Omnitrophota bacterium]
MNKKLSTIIRLVISLGLLSFLVYLMRGDLGQIAEILIRCNYNYIFLAISLFFVTSFMLSYRLKIVFEGENLAISFWESLQLTFMGYFFNNFMPSAVGGDIVKAHLSVKDKANRIKSYASVMMDRIIGLYSFVLLAAFALLVDKGTINIKSIKIAVFALVFGGILIFVIIINEKVAHLAEKFFLKIKMGNIGEKLDSVYKIIHDYRNKLDVVGKSVLVSLVSQSIYFYMIYLFFRSLDSNMPIGIVFLVMPLVTFMAMIPSLGGLGVREGAIVALFSPICGKENAFAASMLLLLGLFFISFVGGIIYLKWEIFNKKQINEANTES